MKNGKFEVGDKVRYVNDTIGTFYERQPLVMKRVYTIRGFFSTNGDVLLEGVDNPNGFGYCQSRFELVEEKKETMKNKIKVLVIKVDNEILSEFIQKLLFKAGLSWTDKQTERNIKLTNFKYLYAHFNSCYAKNKIFVASDYYAEPGYELIDAVKDLPKIMEILLPKPEMEAPKVNGYVMEYKKNDLVATFGCAKISISFLLDVSRMMAEDYEGNRKLDKIVLDSGVTLTKDDVKNILDYRKFVEVNS
jgi:hypothetical protein